MSSSPTACSPEPAATISVATTPTDPDQLSARLAADAVRQVHARDEVPADASLDAHRDPKVPGANYIDAPHDPDVARYWVGLAGEVLTTEVTDPRPGPNPELRQARTQYTAAVEAVRLAEKIPVSTQLFAIPDAFVAGAFFVHEREQHAQVRWVGPDGAVHTGYQLIERSPRWEEATVAARRSALAAQPGTAVLVEQGR